jgi:tripartite-type tricarboxylate transporter receptor subunit TctC
MIRVLLLAVLFSTSALAQNYPARPVTIVVPIPPGGAPDIAARVIAQKLSESLGQPVVVENRVGANGAIATDLVAKSAPDGYTLGLLADSQITINPHLYQKMPLDTLRDLTPVSTVAANQFVLAINPSLPPKTFPEFIEYAKHASPPLAYASGGNGSQHHLTMEMLKRRAGFEMVHVPYKGGSPATMATVSAGKLRALAVSGSRRSLQYPELPTIGEFYPGFANSIWLGIFGPAGMPEPVVERLRAELKRALESADVKAKFNSSGGLEPYVVQGAEFDELIRRDYEKYGKVVKEIGIKLD